MTTSRPLRSFCALVALAGAAALGSARSHRPTPPLTTTTRTRSAPRPTSTACRCSTSSACSSRAPATPSATRDRPRSGQPVLQHSQARDRCRDHGQRAERRHAVLGSVARPSKQPRCCTPPRSSTASGTSSCSIRGPTTSTTSRLRSDSSAPGDFGVTNGGNWAIVGPDFKGKLPKGVIRVRSRYNRVWVIGRTSSAVRPT